MSAHTFWSQFHAYFVEVDDPANPGQPMRPPPGFHIQVRDSATQLPLADILTIEWGQWDPVQYQDTPRVQVSSNGADWVELISIEAQIAGSEAGSVAAVAAQRALDAAIGVTDLQTRMSDVEAALGNSPNGGAVGYDAAAPGTVVRWPLPAQAGQLLARPTTRLDIIVDWHLDNPPPTGSGYSIPGVDDFTDTSPAG